MSDTLFAKIINREIEADIVHEDDTLLAFRDIAPQAPMHILVIPKKPIDMLANADTDDQALLGHMMLTAAKIAVVTLEMVRRLATTETTLDDRIADLLGPALTAASA